MSDLHSAAENYRRAVNAWIGCEAGPIDSKGRYWQRLQLAEGQLSNALVDPQIRAEAEQEEMLADEEPTFENDEVARIVDDVVTAVGNVAERLKAFVSKTKKP